MDADFNKQTVEKICRWVTELSAFSYTIEYMSGEKTHLGRYSLKVETKLCRWVTILSAFSYTFEHVSEEKAYLDKGDSLTSIISA